MRHKSTVDQLAGRQHGVVTRSQLLDAGWSSSRVARERGAGRLHDVHAGVYAVGHRPATNESRWMAAVLACHGSVLSHRSAAQLHGLPVSDNGLAHVTGPTKHARQRVDCHQARLAPQDRMIRRGIPVTSIARTLADLAHSLDDATYHRAVKEAQFKGLFDEAKVQDALARRPARRLKDYVGDGYEAHGTRVAFQDDRTATNALQLGGFVVLRYTHHDVTRRGRLIAAQVRSAGNFSSTHCGPSSARR